ncbi:hypothetical protein ABZ901_31230 [Actinacidiphila alni]|uniref:Uncharacterized protein n=1 Tax=Actinacidiphila alni TaxID=380248 RepID=A0A1I1YH90_9ACTN|nr:hypothetical protein [Actinacidiphila alni]SFE18916.1 hypothetical protein SAMN05216251_10232 [Actinacidiphila alni]
MIDFELVVPDGWVQIPTAPGTATLRRKVVDEVIRHHVPDSLPRDSAGPWRRMLHKELTAATEEAARQNARSVLLPLQEFSGVRLPGSMLVTVIEGDDEAEDAERLLASILADAGDDGSYLEIGGAPAVRVASVVSSGRIERKAPSWRVSYYVSNPDAPGTWGLLTFTVLTDGDVDAEPVQAVMLLFDMIVTTLRWSNRVDVPTEEEVLAQLAEQEPLQTAAAAGPGSGPDAKNS